MEFPLRARWLRNFCITFFCVFAVISLFFTRTITDFSAQAEVKIEYKNHSKNTNKSDFSFEFYNFIGFLNYDNCFCDTPEHPTYSENSTNNSFSGVFLDFCLMDGNFSITTYTNLYFYRNDVLISTFLDDTTVTFTLRDFGQVFGSYRLTSVADIDDIEETEDIFYFAIFNLNGGSAGSDFETNQSILVGKEPVYPLKMIKDGYDFVSWDISGDNSANGALTIKALWSVKTYQLYVKNDNGDLLYQKQQEHNSVISKEEITSFLSTPKYYEDYILTVNNFDFEKIVMVKDETVFLTVNLKYFSLKIFSENENNPIFVKKYQYNSVVNLKEVLLENPILILQESEYFVFKNGIEFIDGIRTITEDFNVTVFINTYTFTAEFYQETEIIYPFDFQFIQVLPLHLLPNLPKDSPTKVGYLFVDFKESGEKIADGVVYYTPQFAINFYTLTIYDNDRVVLVKKLNYGAEFNLLSSLFEIKEGYQLLGFSNSVDGDLSIKVNEAVIFIDNLTLFLVKAIMEFDVNLFINDKLHDKVKIKYAEAFKGYQPQLENAVFLYWKDSLGNRITGDLIVYKNINLYAELYVPIPKFKLTINIDENIIIETDIWEEYERNSKVNINFSIKSGYQLKITECDFNGNVVSYTLTEYEPYNYALSFIFPLSDSIFTLISSPKSYFMICYESIDDMPFNENEPKSSKYQYTDNINFPTKIGYDASYYKDIYKKDLFDLTTMPICDKQDLLIYVHFTAKMVKINLISTTLNDIILENLTDFNDVSKPKSNQYYEVKTTTTIDGKIEYYFLVKYNSDLEYLKLPSSSIVGHIFVGWSQQPFSEPYQGGNIVDDMSLYPLFEQHIYTVTFLNNDVTFSEKSYVFLEKIASPQITPNRVGYTFSHWSGWQIDNFCTNNMQFIAVFDIGSYDIITDFRDTQVDCDVLPTAMYNSRVIISATAKDGFVVNYISLYNKLGKEIDLSIENYGVGLSFIMPHYDIMIKINTSAVSVKNIVKSQTDTNAGVSFTGNINYITNQPPLSYGEYIMDSTVVKSYTPAIPDNILSAYNLNYSIKFNLTFKHIYKDESSILSLGNGGYAIIDIFINDLNSENNIKIFEKNGDAYLEIPKIFDNDSKKVTVSVKNQTVYYILILNDDSTLKVEGFKIILLSVSAIILPIIIVIIIIAIKRRKRVI